MRRRHQLPICAKIPGIKFDIESLKKEMVQISDKWANVFQANRGLCSVHEELADNNYHHFDQITLTYFQESLLEEVKDIKQLKKECSNNSDMFKEGKSKHARYKIQTKRLEGLPPAMNEHNWWHPLDYYKGSYIEKAITSQFEATPIRVRLTRIRAGQYLTPHMDYDTTYAIRIIVPIEGDKDVYNHFWPKNKKVTYELKADGSAYFLNVGYKHSVEHNGDNDRIALMFSLPSQEDIKEL